MRARTSTSPTVVRTVVVVASVAASMGLIVVVAVRGLPAWMDVALLALVCVASAAVAARVLLNELPHGAAASDRMTKEGSTR
jgi:ABC-type phosphate transport system auxiliary subunit